MKLLYCNNCKDLFKLSNHVKECDCGKTYGWHEDDSTAVYYGEFAVPLTIKDAEFSYAKKYTDLLRTDSFLSLSIVVDNHPTFVKKSEET